MNVKEFDVVLYGATGFTGRQSVDYFRHHAPPVFAGPSPVGTGRSLKPSVPVFRCWSPIPQIRLSSMPSSRELAWF